MLIAPLGILIPLEHLILDVYQTRALHRDLLGSGYPTGKELIFLAGQERRNRRCCYVARVMACHYATSPATIEFHTESDTVYFSSTCSLLYPSETAATTLS